ncbi:MAG TPA: hypothetical protein VFQ44_04805 [Streptosporangiaceae bacterium]|nr:hypothetical protein [Streptosporangiaceae bacterium]
MTADLASAASTASAALGTTLSDPVKLAGSGRSVVLRCGRAAGDTVIVKSYADTSEGERGYRAEAAGLEFTTGTGAGPDLLAADPASRLIVMRDLGEAPSLADVLLTSSPAGARQARGALLGWTKACAELAVSTASRAAEYAGVQARHALGQSPGGAQSAGAAGGHWLARRIWEIPGLLGKLSLDLPGGIEDDLAEVASLLSAAEFRVFSPGDLCPDNNLITSDGVRFIDFEYAEYHSAFLDAAYLSMPFSTCWCVFRLPPELARQAQATYRDLVSAAFPAAASDEVWLPGVRRASAAWTLHSMTYLLEASMAGDASMNPRASHAPTARQLLRYRWRRLAGELGGAGELPAITSLMSQLLTRTRSWQSPALPLYPAFRRTS